MASRNKMGNNFAAWFRGVWQAIKDSHGVKALGDYLDLDVECLRECLLEVYRRDQFPQEQIHQLILALDCLTSLRYGSETDPRWIATGLPPRQQCSRSTRPTMFNERNIQVVREVLALVISVPPSPEMSELSWQFLREWLEQYWQSLQPTFLESMD